MSWRTIVISNSSKLDYQMGYMVVRQKECVKVHLNEIYMLIVETTAVSITAALLSELIKNKVKVIFCDEKRNPSSELMPFYGSFDTSEKIRRQITWTDEQKKTIWTEIVSEKIRNQAIHLQETGHDQESSMLLGYVNELEYVDRTNREGHAAKVYFNALFGMDFTRTAENSINAALNYGYGIILSAFNREICANGYLTQLGFFHDSMFNQFNLACDLMEPYRPIIDRLVLEMHPKVFGTEEKHHIISIMNKELFVDGRKESLGKAVKIYTRSIFDSLNDQDISAIKFYTL